MKPKKPKAMLATYNSIIDGKAKDAKPEPKPQPKPLKAVEVPGRSCFRCEYFFKNSLTAGQCRLKPPIRKDLYPDVGVNDWCGEFKDKGGDI